MPRSAASRARRTLVWLVVLVIAGTAGLAAAVQLSTHSELTVPEAFELLRRMRERREGQVETRAQPVPVRDEKRHDERP